MGNDKLTSSDMAMVATFIGENFARFTTFLTDYGCYSSEEAEAEAERISAALDEAAGLQ